MPAMTADKILFLLSGGHSNTAASMSLGGPPSSHPVGLGINAIFPDVSEDQMMSGHTEHRCIYVVNSSEDAPLKSISIHTQNDPASDVKVTLGIARRTESQVVSVEDTVFFGIVKFDLYGNEVAASWDGSAESFASSLRSSLVALGLQGVEVSNSYLGSSHKFTILFGGELNNKSQPLLTVRENLLSGLARPRVSTERQTSGSPINSEAPTIATPQVTPYGVEFLESSPSSAIMVGTMAPGDYMPVWIRRHVPRGSKNRQGDTTTIKVSGST